MDYEKKYKEMKARVLEMGRGYVKGLDYSKPRQIAEYIDPELKESEDEKIRKELIDFLEYYRLNNVLDSKTISLLTDSVAWLEKQGEQKFMPQEYADAFDEFMSHIPEKEPEFSESCYNYDDMVSAIQFGIKWQQQHDSIVKVKPKYEPKFHKGDWVIGRATENEPRQIAEITEDGYKSTYGGWYGFSFEEDMHLWTIKDAKDGDVLFQNLMGGKTFIYNGVNPDMAILYSFIISNDGEDVLPYHIGKPNTGIGNIEENKNIIHPATKEQREQLEKAMADAGYEWDAEKKELKKIEHKTAEEYNITGISSKNAQGKLGEMIKNLKPTDKVEPKFKVGDKIYLKTEYRMADDDTPIANTVKEIIRIDDKHYRFNGSYIFIEDQDKYELVEQKTAWSEEDEEQARQIERIILHEGYTQKLQKQITDWLKSIKDRVGCEVNCTTTKEWSEEDMEMIRTLIAIFAVNYPNGFYKVNPIVTTNMQGIHSSEIIKRLKSLRLQNNITDEELAQAKKDAYNDVLDKLEYNSENPTFDDGWSAAIWYLKKRNAQFKNTWKPSDEQLNALDMKEVDLEKLGEMARHLIAVKEHIEDMRLDKEEWLMLEKIGYSERFKTQKGEKV